MSQREKPELPLNNHKTDNAFLSVIVPLYQSRDTVSLLLETIYNSLTPYLYEIILVNDGSTDVDTTYFQNLKSQFPLLHVLTHNQNMGQNVAIDTGLKNAKGDWLLVMDCDLQDPPSESLKLIETAYETNADAILSVRKNRSFSTQKNLLSLIYYTHFFCFAGRKHSQNAGSMVLINAHLRNLIIQDKYNNVPYIQRIKKHANRAIKVTTEHAIRAAGKSSYTLKKRLELALDSYFFAQSHLIATTLVALNLITIFMFSAENNKWIATFYCIPVLNTFILLRNIILRNRFSMKAEYNKWV